MKERKIKLQHIQKASKVSFLTISAVVTMAAMVMCILSAVISLMALDVAMKTYLNVNTAKKVGRSTLLLDS